jgi:DNA processing protein
MSSQNLEAWLKLSLIPNIDKMRLTQLVEHYGSPEAVFEASIDGICRLDNFSPELATSIIDNKDKVDVSEELKLIEKFDVKIVTYKDENYPENLKNIPYPPAFLYFKGDLLSEDKFSIAVIGSRRNSQYGKMVCNEIAGKLAEYGLTIVSGMAQGIDSIAHISALKKDKRTIAILGNGLSKCYPAEHKGLMERIAKNGAVISEFPMTTKPFKQNFPVRNRTISGLTLGTLVIEASEKSGALITADCAVEFGRAVYAVPGDINRENSKGTNALIQKGAKLVQNADDIISDLRFLLKGFIIEEKAKDMKKITESLSEGERVILDILKNDVLYFDQILDQSNMSMGELSNILLNLEIKDLIKQFPGKMFGKNI